MSKEDKDSEPRTKARKTDRGHEDEAFGYRVATEERDGAWSVLVTQKPTATNARTTIVEEADGFPHEGQAMDHGMDWAMKNRPYIVEVKPSKGRNTNAQCGRSLVRYTLVTGDSASELKRLPTASAVALFEDPPAGMGLMDLKWEAARGPAFCESLKPVFAECRRILKPGHWSLTWAHPKTSHWTAVALELSGFEIVTSIIHLNPEAKPASPGLLAPGHEVWILARVPGPVVPLNVRAWTVERHPRTVVLGSGYSKALDALIGSRKSGAYSGKRNTDKHRNTYGAFKGTTAGETPRAASLGGPSRYFPSADDLITMYAPRARHSHRALYPGGPRSEHPTPKSLGLVLPLLDLITGCAPEPNGLVVDPFMGSGSTGAAAAILGLDFFGCDSDPACAIEAEQRLAYWSAPL